MPTRGQGNSVFFLKEMEGAEEKKEDIRRQEETKKEEGCMKQHGGWRMRGTSLFHVNRAQ